jgi:hypothetical protein
MSAAVFFSELFAQAGQHRLVIDRIERLQPTLPERHRSVCVTESGDGSSTSRSFKKGIAASREVDFFGARMITETGVRRKIHDKQGAERRNVLEKIRWTVVRDEFTWPDNSDRDKGILDNQRCRCPCCDRRANAARWRNYRPRRFRSVSRREHRQIFAPIHVPGRARMGSNRAGRSRRIHRRVRRPKRLGPRRVL